RRFDAGGSPLGPEVPVNATTSGDQDTPAISSNGDPGTFVIAWRSAGQDGSGSGVFARVYPGGAPQSGEIPVNEHTAGDQGSPAVAMEVSGAFAVSWESADQDGHLAGLYERRFDPWGAPEGPEMPVNVSTCRAQQSPSLTLDAAGRALVAWSSPQDVSNRMI